MKRCRNGHTIIPEHRTADDKCLLCNRERSRQWRIRQRNGRSPRGPAQPWARRVKEQTTGNFQDIAAYKKILYNDPCSYCGLVGGSADHIVPLKLRGEHDWTNLTSSCRYCNARKSAKPMLLWMSEKFNV